MGQPVIVPACRRFPDLRPGLHQYFGTGYNPSVSFADSSPYTGEPFFAGLGRRLRNAAKNGRQRISSLSAVDFSDYALMAQRILVEVARLLARHSSAEGRITSFATWL